MGSGDKNGKNGKAGKAGGKDGNHVIEMLKGYVDPFRIDAPDDFRLNHCATAERLGIDKVAAQGIIEDNRKRLAALQEKLYAQDRWAMLLVFQGMDAAGKDSAIESVMSGVNPQGCQVYSFKAPSSQELDHDYLWRCAMCLPERGRIGIFNRSYYEEVLVVRVHPEFLDKQKLPPSLITKDIWHERFDDINHFERYLTRNGIVVLKFFLNVSKDEQRERFLDRLEEPGKRWKFSMGDIAERALWDKYQAAYQDMIHRTSTGHAPWHVVPSDHKWAARVIIGSAIVSALEKLDLQYPRVDDASLKEYEAVRKALKAEEQAEKAAKKGAKDEK